MSKDQLWSANAEEHEKEIKQLLRKKFKDYFPDHLIKNVDNVECTCLTLKDVNQSSEDKDKYLAYFSGKITINYKDNVGNKTESGKDFDNLTVRFHEIKNGGGIDDILGKVQLQ